MKILSMCLILISVIIIVVGIVVVHELPGKIARRRGHPQAEAIRICSLLGLVVFPFWMAALLWAYIRPVFTPVPLDTEPEKTGSAKPQVADGEPV
jgi:hypothetical protein